MIPFEEIDSRLKQIGKDRKWLAQATRRSEAAINSALAPGSSPVKKSKSIQGLMTDAIEREEATMNERPVQLSHLTLRISTEELNEWAKAYKASDLDTLEDWTLQAIREYIRGAAEEVLKDQQRGVITTFPAKPHLQAAAGSPLGADVEEWDGKDDTVIVKISGLSMEPLLHDGEVVTMRHKRVARSQYMKKGLIYLVSYDGGYVVKEYNTRAATQEEIDANYAYLSKESGKPKVKILRSLNPDFPEIIIKQGVEWIAWINADGSLPKVGRDT
jgi:phage repressor protein C with HTH and peptisase S24 domain